MRQAKKQHYGQVALNALQAVPLEVQVVLLAVGLFGLAVTALE